MRVMSSPDENQAKTKTTRLRWAVRVALLLIVFVMGWYLIGRATAGSRAIVQSGEDTPTPTQAWDGENLRVVAYNIAHGRGLSESNWAGDRNGRLAEIADLLIELDADIVVLNEVDFDSSWSGRKNQARLIADRAGYLWVTEQTNYDLSLPLFRLRFGNAILSRFPIVDSQRFDYPAVWWAESVGFGQKHGLWCQVELSPEQSVRVVAVHLDTRDAQVRIDSAEAIRQLALSPGPPIIVAGDFNSVPAGAGHPPSAIDIVRSTQGMEQTQSYFDSAIPLAGSFPSNQPTRLIDHIAAQLPWHLTSFEVVSSPLSDHCPVACNLLLAGSASADDSPAISEP